jgi:hypothetical protein
LQKLVVILQHKFVLLNVWSLCVYVCVTHECLCVCLCDEELQDNWARSDVEAW